MRDAACQQFGPVRRGSAHLIDGGQDRPVTVLRVGYVSGKRLGLAAVEPGHHADKVGQRPCPVVGVFDPANQSHGLLHEGTSPRQIEPGNGGGEPEEQDLPFGLVEIGGSGLGLFGEASGQAWIAVGCRLELQGQPPKLFELQIVGVLVVEIPP